MERLYLDPDKSYEEMKKRLIHPWERPTRVLNLIIFAFACVASLSVFFTPALKDLVASFSYGSYGGFAIFAIIGLVIYALGSTYAKTKAISLKLSQKQFPEVYAVIKKYADRMELGYMPEAYLVQKGGAINAFATSFFRRRYISINSDVFEVFYLEHKDLETLSFIIAHEIAHLKRYHATTLMAILEAPAKVIPIYASAVSRIREYTSDRHAAWLCPEGIDGVMMLSVGKHLYKYVDVDEYIEVASKQYKGLFCFLHNLTASHPVFPKRVKALKNLDKRGRVF